MQWNTHTMFINSTINSCALHHSSNTEKPKPRQSSIRKSFVKQKTNTYSLSYSSRESIEYESSLPLSFSSFKPFQQQFYNDLIWHQFTLVNYLWQLQQSRNFSKFQRKRTRENQCGFSSHCHFSFHSKNFTRVRLLEGKMASKDLEVSPKSTDRMTWKERGPEEASSSLTRSPVAMWGTPRRAESREA